MKNQEYTIELILETILSVSNKKIIGVIVISLYVVYLTFFQISYSLLICNNGYCQIQSKSRVGTTISAKKINLSEIKSFDYKNDYDWYGAYANLEKRYSSNSRRIADNNRYIITAKDKNGKEFEVFPKYKKSKQLAVSTVNQLNEALQMENPNVNIKY